MAADTRVTVLCRNDMVDALVAYAGADAKLIIYDGDVPATSDTALDAQVALATLTIPSFGVDGAVATAAAITVVAADETGTATFFRVYKSNGTTCVWQGTVGTLAADLVLNDVDLVAGGGIGVTALTFTLNE